MLLAKTGSKRVESRSCLIERHVRPQAGNRVADGDISRRVDRRPAQRTPERRVGHVCRSKRLGHDTDDLVRLAVDPHDAANGRWIAAEPRRPDREAEYHHAARVLDVIRLTEASAERRPRTEHIEILERCLFTGQRFRRVAFRETRRPAAHGRDAPEHIRRALPVRLVRRSRPLRRRSAAPTQILKHHHEPRWIGIGQRADQDGVDDAVDRGVGADSERKRHECDNRQSARLRHHSEREAHVAP